MDGLIRLKGATFPVTPNPPAGRFYIGVDATDGHFKKQDSTGVVTDYDSGAAFTAEDAQDAVGSILTDTASVDFTYNDASNQITADIIPGGVNHNALSNYVSDEHIPHSVVNIQTVGTSGLQGGGSIAATRSLSLNLSGLPEKTRAGIADEVVIYDPIDLTHKKMKSYRVQRCGPDRYVYTSSDFIQSTLGDLIATFSGSGASAQAGTFGIDLTENAQGVLQIDTGTTATGRSATSTASVNHLWVQSGTILRTGWRVVPELLSTGLETFSLWIGFADNFLVAGEPTDGCYFRYNDAVNGGRWEAVVAAGATRQAFDTGILASLNYQIFEVEIDFTGPGPIVRYSIDGTLTNTVQAPSPVPVGPTQAFGYGVKMEKTVGTGQRNTSIDWYCFELDRNAAR